MSKLTNSELAQEFLKEDTDVFREWFAEHKEEYKYDIPKVRKIKYDINKSPQDNSRAQRNNMLIDLINGILTNSSTSYKFLNPGNFDTIKLQSRITKIVTDPNMYSAFLKEFNIDSRSKAISKLLQLSREGNLKVLDDFLKKYRKVKSQLTLETFVYNHTQNMTGAALIGMYANNTTSQAKYQYSQLALKNDKVFFINGRKIQSLHDITSQLGERISRNCAQFSAASVDNVKDPVLADLLQNMNTAKVTAFMLRAGMSIEEISLLFAQPIVRECILQTGGLDKLDRYINSKWTELSSQGGSVNENIITKNFTSEELMNNTLAEHYSSSLSKEEYNKIQASQIQAALLMKHIVSMSNYMSELTQISRADSPNGAILNTLAGSKVQIAKVERFINMSKSKEFPFIGVSDALQNDLVTETMDINSLREALMKRSMPMLQAFYSLGIELGTKNIGKYFQQVNSYSDTMLKTILNNAPLEFLSNKNQANATKTIGLFYKDLVNFALSQTKTFGNDDSQSFEEKRDYYLNEYPNEFLTAKSNNPDISKLGLFSKLTVKDGKIQLLRSGRMRQQARDSFMRDMDSLLYMGDEGIKMAKDLFMYAYYNEGFWFGPNSFGTFFSTNFFNSFPEVTEALRYMREGMKNGTLYDRFLSQYYANHYMDGIVVDVSNSDNTLNKDKVLEGNDGSIFVPISKSFNRTMNEGLYSYVSYNGSLYHISLENSSDDKTVYRPVPTLNTYKYNANMTIDEMKEFDSEVSNSTNNSITQLDLSDFSYLDSSLDSSLDEFLSQLDQFDEQSGEETLQDSMCK